MKSGKVQINDTGAVTFVDGAGALNMIADALTTAISTTSAPIGYTALIQRGALLVAGNMIGIHSGTGRLGVGVAGRNILFGS